MGLTDAGDGAIVATGCVTGASVGCSGARRGRLLWLLWGLSCWLLWGLSCWLLWGLSRFFWSWSWYWGGQRRWSHSGRISDWSNCGWRDWDWRSCWVRGRWGHPLATCGTVDASDRRDIRSHQVQGAAE
uniref:Uncharacterized protein n=1 Tax=Globisporangium ultimum (strain ATCC 200006 / CBS 805.95 / DAOM BR144) TaxID=431595 RepID=K3WDZ8_GLOUD